MTTALDVEVTVDRGGSPYATALRAGPGDIVAVAGPNGAGKTTLLSSIAGTVRAQGRIEAAGRTWLGPEVSLPPQSRRVGVVHQDHRLFPHLTAARNVAFGPRSRGASRAAAMRTAHTQLDRLGVAHLAQRRPAELSGGQSQRVAIARALATDPTVLLLDEPFAALDVAGAQALRQLLADHLEDYAGVTLLVTHDPLDVFTLADRVLVLEDGVVRQDASPRAVADNPATAHAAKLVGLNVLSGLSSDRHVRLEDGGDLVTGTPAEGRVLVSFSPAAVALTSHEPTGSPRNRWRTRVQQVIRLPASTRVHLKSPDVVAEVTHEASDELGLRPGEVVWASLKAMEVSVIKASSPVGPDPDRVRTWPTP